MIRAYQWRPHMGPRDAPEVKYDMHGAFVMDGSSRVVVNPMWWVVVEDDGHVDVKPPTWKPE